jgi:MFS family permease
MSNGFSVLKHRNFRFYVSARVLGTIAIQMQNVAIGWQVYAMTGNVYDLGMIGLAQFAPFLALILFAGHVADTYNRRHIIIGCYIAQLLCSLSLFAYTMTGSHIVWPVFAVLVLYGSARAFMMPATQAILIHLVPTESFTKAVALSSSSFQVAVIVGPALGGAIYSLSGAHGVYWLVAALQVAAIVLMSCSRLASRPAKREPASWHTLFEGLRFVRAQPIVLGAMSLDLFAVLFGGATALLPAFAHDVLHTGPAALGMLRTATGVGAIVISIALAFRPITTKVGRWMFGGVAVFGAGTVVLGTTDSLIVSLIALFLMGAGDMVSVYIRHIIVQFATPDAIRGRVSAVNAVFIGASNELGEFESGITAGWFGLIRALVLGGVATLIVTATWAKLFPVLSKMDRFPHAETEKEDTVDPVI